MADSADVDFSEGLRVGLAIITAYAKRVLESPPARDVVFPVRLDGEDYMVSVTCGSTAQISPRVATENALRAVAAGIWRDSERNTCGIACDETAVPLVERALACLAEHSPMQAEDTGRPVAGLDAVFLAPGWSRDAQRRTITAYVCARWPACVMMRSDRIPHERVFYRDEAAQRDWGAHGRTESNARMMVHFIPGDGQFTLVYEGDAIDPDAIRRNIRTNPDFA